MRAKLFRDVPFARTGFQTYAAEELNRPGAGMLRVHRSRLEVAKSASTFESVPVTMDHPASLLTPDNAMPHTVGIVSDVRFDEQTEQLRGDLILWQQDAITAVANGVRELSGGYRAQYEDQPGGALEQYDIRGNHVAIVPKGRSGEAQRIGAA